MRSAALCLSLAWLWSLAHPSVALAQLPPDTLARLKASTVYIETDQQGETSSGSGLVLSREGQSATVATNYHVIKGTGPRRDWKIVCYFNSGLPNQFQVEAKLLAVNYDDDLALLSVTHADLPEPINIDSSAVAMETQRVYAAGFPFGQMLGVGGQKPALTVTEGSISSIRRGRFGEPTLVQLSGGIDPGNSGGPVIDAAGNLVAISVAKISQSSIGFGIPAWKVHELRQPIVRNLKATAEASTLTCRGDINPVEGLDNRQVMHTTHLLAVRQPEAEQVLARFVQQSWQPIAGHGEPRRCQTAGSRPETSWLSVSSRLPLDEIPGAGSTFVLQWRTTLGDGRYVYSRPYVFTESELREPSAVAAAEPGSPAPSVPSAVDAITRQQIPVADATVHPFTGQIRRVMRAGDNRYLVVYTSNNTLHCIDLSTEQIVATRPGVTVDVLASGRTDVVGFNRTERSLTRYRIPDLQPAGKATLSDGAAVRYAHRGNGSSGPIVAIVQRAGIQKLACVLIDPSRGRLSRLSLTGEKLIRGQAPSGPFDAMPMTEGFRLRMSDDGSLISVWYSDSDRVPTQVLKKHRQQWKYSRLEPSQGYAIPGPSGSLLCTSEAVLAGDLTQLHRTPINLPTTSDDYFMTVGDVVKPTGAQLGLFTWQVASASEATVYQTVILEGDLLDASVGGDDVGSLPLDERFQCLPQWNRFVVVPPGPSRELRVIAMGEPLPNVQSFRDETADESPSLDGYRTWTASQGSYHVKAKFLGRAGNVVQLKTEDGRDIQVPLDRLSGTDQAYIRSLE